MQRQLKFWPTAESHPKRSPVWEQLTAQQRAPLITALARLIRQTVWAETNHSIQEKPHEPS